MPIPPELFPEEGGRPYVIAVRSFPGGDVQLDFYRQDTPGKLELLTTEPSTQTTWRAKVKRLAREMKLPTGLEGTLIIVE